MYCPICKAKLKHLYTDRLDSYIEMGYGYKCPRGHYRIDYDTGAYFEEYYNMHLLDGEPDPEYAYHRHDEKTVRRIAKIRWFVERVQIKLIKIVTGLLRRPNGR